MTDTMMKLRTLVEMEVGAATGAGYAEKSAERRVQRDGYRERDWETRAVTVELRIPSRARAAILRAF